MLKEQKFEKYSTICYICALALIVLTLVLFCFQYLHVSYNVKPVETFGQNPNEYNVELSSNDLATAKVTKLKYKNGDYLIGEEYEGTSCSAYGAAKAKTFSIVAYSSATKTNIAFDLEYDEANSNDAKKYFFITEYPNDFKQEFTGYSMILNESRDFRVAGFLTLLILIMFGIILLSIALGFFSSRKEATLKSLISVNVFMIVVIVMSFILMGFIYTKLEYMYSGRGLGDINGKFQFQSIAGYEDLTYGMTAVPIIGFVLSVASYVVFRIFAAKGKYKV